MDPTIAFETMPTYVYKFIDTGETIEVQQSFNDESLTEAVHPSTGATMPVKKVFLPVGITFKGDGFYKTDSRASKKATSKKSSDGESGGTSDSSGSKESASNKSDSSSSSSSTSSTSSTAGAGASSGSGSSGSGSSGSSSSD